MTAARFAACVVAMWCQRAMALPTEPVPAEPAPVKPTPDELAQAADAAAAVAAIGGPEAPGEPIDLASLGLDPHAATLDDKLNVYGFADIGLVATHFVHDLMVLPQTSKTFFVGNFNLYVARTLTPKTRALGEVRFTFVPNGTVNADGSYVDATGQDLSNVLRPVQWGGIVVERLYLERDITDFLTVRLGHWLTPYGIWNIDHGSPVIIGTVRPYIIGQQLFPEHQTGIDLFGGRYLGAFKLNYHATVSNGRGGTEAVADRDNKLAFGARLELVTPWWLELGLSYYRGRFTGLPANIVSAPETYREVSIGGDLRIDHGPLHAQLEAILQDRHYAPGARMSADGTPVSRIRATGIYAIGGYRFDVLWNVMPFAYYETYDPGELGVLDGSSQNIGLNFRPTPNLVYKVQASRVKLGDGIGILAGQTSYVGSAQASWVF